MTTPGAPSDASDPHGPQDARGAPDIWTSTAHRTSRVRPRPGVAVARLAALSLVPVLLLGLVATAFGSGEDCRSWCFTGGELALFAMVLSGAPVLVAFLVGTVVILALRHRAPTTARLTWWGALGALGTATVLGLSMAHQFNWL